MPSSSLLFLIQIVIHSAPSPNHLQATSKSVTSHNNNPLAAFPSSISSSNPARFSYMRMRKQKNNLFKNLATHLGLGCGCGCSSNSATRSKSNIPDVYEPKPKPEPKSAGSSIFTSEMTSPSTIISSSSLGSNDIIEEKKSTRSATCNSITEISTGSTRTGTAVVMESQNPFEDFQESMLEMIMENEIFCTEQLVQLLHCFLRLNSPAHHHIILSAFFQVCHFAVLPSSN